ncbi:MAG: RsiV family protein [Psychrobacter sp.]
MTLTDKGVDIRYQPYAIGPYAYGMPVLTIAYDNLTGILKPRFLPSI